MDNKQLWQATLGELELMLSRANFVTWFKNTYISTFENNKVIVAVPNTFTKAWFEKKYHIVILKALQKITNSPIKELFYKVETSKEADVNAAESKINETVVLRSTPNFSAAESIPSEIGLNSKYSFQNFVIGKGNELAQAACIAVADKPGRVYNPLFIYGGAGLGKTHLLQAIGNKIISQNSGQKILYVSCEKFTNDFIRSISSNTVTKFKNIYRSVDILLIDDIQFLAGKEGTQEEFFHTFNALHQNNKQIVISSDRPPKAIPALENRLISRFEWGMMADVSIPDLETRIAILEAKCREKTFNLAKEIINYIAASIQNNVRELEGVLNRIIALSQLTNKMPDVEETKKIVQSLSGGGYKKSITPKQIINVVATFYDIKIDDLMGSCRKKNLSNPRQIIMYLMREEIKSSYPAIGQEIGNRDHTTAMHAYLKISNGLNDDEKLNQDINLIKQRLYNQS